MNRVTKSELRMLIFMKGANTFPADWHCHEGSMKCITNRHLHKSHSFLTHDLKIRRRNIYIIYMKIDLCGSGCCCHFTQSQNNIRDDVKAAFFPHTLFFVC